MGVKYNVLNPWVMACRTTNRQAILDANLFAADIDDTKPIASNMELKHQQQRESCVRDIQRRTNGVKAVADFGSQDTAAMALKVIRRVENI